MTHCAKCGAELIGMRKFCAACGHPSGDPRSPAASTGLAPVASGYVPPSPGSAPASSRAAPSIQYAPPTPRSAVNPYAQTADSASNENLRPPRTSDYGPPPAPHSPELATTARGVGDPSVAPQVSPLAVSNAATERGAFERAITAGPESARAAAGALFDPSRGSSGAPPAAPAASMKQGRVAGTEIMQSIPFPPTPSAAAPSAGGTPAAPKRQDRTQLLEAFPAGGPAFPGIGATPVSGAPSVGHALASAHAPSIPSATAQPPQAQPAPLQAPSPHEVAAAYAPSAPLPAPSAPEMAAPYAPPPVAAVPPPVAAVPPPVAAVPPPVAAVPPPAQASPWIPPAATPYGAPQPAATPYGAAVPYGYPGAAPPAPEPAPPPPPPPAGYGFFGYAPGSRVHVTWSNGQRYPGTVHQVSGSQCLVMFPDGQQHWVEMQYVAPA
jgi:hypothetical protein